MPQTTVGSRILASALLVTSMAGTAILIPPSPAYADTPAICARTVLVLDESGSVAPYEANVRDAVMSFLTSLVGSGVEATAVEFGEEATTVFGSYLSVDEANLGNLFGPYINATSAGDVYDAPSDSGPSTNWDDALDQVTQINESLGVAPIVLFLTDGDPTAYNLDHTGEPGGVQVSGTTPTALNRAIDEADEIETQGSHLIAVGVGSGLSNPASIGRLTDLAGPNVYDGSGALDLAATDVVLVPDFADLPEAMALIAAAMCADPEITVEKTSSSPVVIPGTEVSYSIDVTNTGNVHLHDVVLEDPLVPDCSQDIGDLAVGETITVECSTALWAPLTNTATASGTDPFGTPTEGEGSTSTILIAAGTGTPGFWKNHEDVWPVADDIVLIGDWNHNWECDAGETCLELTRDEALAALGTPARGDMTWNLARALIAAWLNVSSGNDSSCVADTIDMATDWLMTHPIGSDVGGSDPEWGVASAWAETLDQYNNGLLCADHRDAKGEAEEIEATTTAHGAVTPPGGELSQRPKEHWDASGGNPPPHSSKGRNKP